MDQITNAYERVKVVLGVSGGIISIQQVQDIARLCHLDEVKQTALNAMLSESGIRLIPDEELPQSTPAPQTIPKKPQKKESTSEERAERFDSALLACLKDMTEVPSLVNQYQEEIPLLKKAIAEEAADSKQKQPDLVITRAIMEIAHYRNRDVRDKGWVCGTHTTRVRNLFRQHWLCRLFNTEEMNTLIRYCGDTDGTKDPRKEDALLIMLHNAPHVIVHPCPSLYYSD